MDVLYRQPAESLCQTVYSESAPAMTGKTHRRRRSLQHTGIKYIGRGVNIGQTI